MVKLGNFIASLENLEAPVAEEELDAAATATEVAEVGGEAAAEEVTIDSTDSALADAEATEDKVEELQTVAADSLVGDDETVAEGEVGVEGDGLSEGEATLVEITHEALMRSIGMPITRIKFTNESFNSKDNRRQATLEALDNLKASAKNIGNNIVAALKAALNTVVNFITGLLRNRSMMEKHLVNLQSKVNAIPADAAPKSETVSGGSKMGGSSQSASTLLDNATKLIAGCNKVADALKNGEAAVKSAISSGGFNGVAIVDGKQVKVAESEDGVKLEIVEGTKGTGEAKALSKTEMTGLLTKAVGVIKSLAAFEKTQNSLKSAVANILSRLQEAYHGARTKVGGSTSDKFDHGIDGMAKKDARLARSLMATVGGKIPGAVFQAVKGTADYVTASLNNFKSAAAPAAAEATAA